MTKAQGRNFPSLGFSVSKKSKRYGVIPNQSADWCGNPPVERKSYWFRIENI